VGRLDEDRCPHHGPPPRQGRPAVREQQRGQPEQRPDHAQEHAKDLARWVREAREAGLDDETIEELLRVTLRAADNEEIA
jgi:hypothetical protein